LDALDLLLSRMKADGVPLHRVAAVSGSGQQHGSVYLRREAAGVLSKLSPDASLSEQLAPALAMPDSPIWMDSSTSAECRQLEAAVGGAQALASLTGSRAYERFTAHQILRLSKTQPDAYAATDRVCLVRCGEQRYMW
jgi:xylulokinase